jgi:hypothetical protein
MRLDVVWALGQRQAFTVRGGRITAAAEAQPDVWALANRVPEEPKIKIDRRRHVALRRRAMAAGSLRRKATTPTRRRLDRHQAWRKARVARVSFPRPERSQSVRTAIKAAKAAALIRKIRVMIGAVKEPTPVPLRTQAR